MTSDRSGEPHIKTAQPGLVSVFVPTTPNPTSGFLVMAPIEDLVILEMKVDDAMKMIISLGVVIPVWKSQVESHLEPHQQPAGAAVRTSEMGTVVVEDPNAVAGEPESDDEGGGGEASSLAHRQSSS